MADLPKIAQARLRGKSHAPGESSAGKEGFAAPGGHHPDANLLGAFAEKALSETERARVLHHLNHCAECREAAAFALPENSATIDSAETATRRQLSPWPILHWGALAAMMAALAIVITVHPNIWQNHSRATVSEPPAGSAGNAGGPPAAQSSPAAAPPSNSAAPQTDLPVRKSPALAGALEKKSPSDRERVVAGGTTGGLAMQQVARQQVTALASTQPPAQIQSSPSSSGEQSAGGAAPADVQAPAPLQQSQTPSGTPQNSLSGFQAAQQNNRSLDAVAAKAAPHDAVQQSTGATAAAPLPADQQARQDSASASEKEVARTQAAGSPPRAFMSRAATTSPTNVPAVRQWFVTSDGKVFRTARGGNLPQVVSVAEGIEFRAVAALGNDVWAGGVGGALFHSSDGGDTFTRVAVTLEDGPANATITGIQLTQPGHITITIASGARYISEDAGRHWR